MSNHIHVQSFCTFNGISCKEALYRVIFEHLEWILPDVILSNVHKICIPSLPNAALVDF